MANDQRQAQIDAAITELAAAKASADRIIAHAEAFRERIAHTALLDEITGWRCERCIHVMSSNMRMCPACGYTVYKPLFGTLPDCTCGRCKR